MAKPTVSTFGAAGPMLGYLFQVRTALLWAIRRSKAGDFVVDLEVLDDVSFSKAGDAVAVLQTKHSINSECDLSDFSSELWKTLRVWLVGVSSGEVGTHVTKFLISTGEAKSGTACEWLCTDTSKRNVREAAKLLVHVASTSTNTQLKDVFATFLALDLRAREKFLGNVYVVPKQPNAADIDAALKAELYYVSIQHQDLACQMLEGWWFQRVVSELVEKGPGISKAEIDAQISDIQESLKSDHLPIDGEIDALMVALDQLSEFANRPFYKQVEIVGAGQGRIRNAVTSYLQAFRQRSAWTRNDLLFDADLSQYDERLISEWKLLRDQICDELGEEAGEEELAKAGRAILKWAEDAPIPIRSGVNVPWVCRGSFHMLADDRKLGWHPEFEARMSVIFDMATVEKHR